MGCRRKEKIKERTKISVGGRISTRTKLKKDNKQAETAVFATA
jgi:hypothetical protein